MQDQGGNSPSYQGDGTNVKNQQPSSKLTVNQLTNSKPEQQVTVEQQTAQTGEKVADTLKDTNNAQGGKPQVAEKLKKYDSVFHKLDVKGTTTTQYEYPEGHLKISTIVRNQVEGSDNITININYGGIILNKAIFNKIKFIEVVKGSLSSKQLFKANTKEGDELTPGFLKCEDIEFFRGNNGKTIEIELKLDFTLYDNDQNNSLPGGKKFLKGKLQKDSDGSYYIEVEFYSEKEMKKNGLYGYAEDCLSFLQDPYSFLGEGLEFDEKVSDNDIGTHLNQLAVEQYELMKESLGDFIDFKKYGEVGAQNIKQTILDLKGKVKKEDLLNYLSKARCDIDKFEIVYIPDENINNDDAVKAIKEDETDDNLTEDKTEQSKIHSVVQFDVNNEKQPFEIAPEIIDIFKKHGKGEKIKKGSSWKKPIIGFLLGLGAGGAITNFLQNTPTDTSLFPSSQDNNPAQITQNLSDKRSTINSSTPIVKAQANTKISSIGKILKISNKDKDKYLKQFIKTQGINTSILKTDNFDKYTNKLQGDILNLKYWDEIKVIIRDNIIIGMEAINLENGNKIEYGVDSTVTWKNY